MMSGRDDVRRRVSVISVDDRGGGDYPTRPAVPEQRDPGDGERLASLLRDIAVKTRLGRYRADAQQGILLDTVVDNVRCLLIEQEPAMLVTLSPREQQIARMVANGRTNHAIASALEISVWTVSTHLRRIFAKLAVSSRAEMVAHLLANADLAHLVDNVSRRT